MFLGRVVGDGESSWLEDDRQWAIALVESDRDRCSGCGHPLSETTAVVADERTGKQKPAHTYAVDVWPCAACQEIEAQQQGREHRRADNWSARRLD